MGIIKVEIEDEILEKFKRKAMETYGYRKGSIKLATIEALKNWLETNKKEKEKKTKEFIESMEKASGCWKSEPGYKYVRGLRKESEKRLRRLRI